jgi:hypothetical protein
MTNRDIFILFDTKKAIFNDLQERTNMKIIDYMEDMEKQEFDLFD